MATKSRADYKKQLQALSERVAKVISESTDLCGDQKAAMLEDLGLPVPPRRATVRLLLDVFAPREADLRDIGREFVDRLAGSTEDEQVWVNAEESESSGSWDDE